MTCNSYDFHARIPDIPYPDAPPASACHSLTHNTVGTFCCQGSSAWEYKATGRSRGFGSFYVPKRQGEIHSLTWGQVHLKERFIRLEPEDTKTNEGRLVPFNGEIRKMFKGLPRNLPAARVFNRHGKPINSIREAFEAACRRAEIEKFTFHNLRHTAINNWRLQGHDYFRIMAATGHKTLNMFKRYNTVSKDELKALVGENR
ncbi:MAG: site-specific integrase [Deltaproteobacteria bacterium]